MISIAYLFRSKLNTSSGVEHPSSPLFPLCFSAPLQCGDLSAMLSAEVAQRPWAIGLLLVRLLLLGHLCLFSSWVSPVGLGLPVCHYIRWVWMVRNKIIVRALCSDPSLPQIRHCTPVTISSGVEQFLPNLQIIILLVVPAFITTR